MLERKFHGEITPLLGTQPTRFHQDRQRWSGCFAGCWRGYRHFGTYRLRRLRNCSLADSASRLHDGAAAGSSGGGARDCGSNLPRQRSCVCHATVQCVERGWTAATRSCARIWRPLTRELPTLARLLVFYSMSDIHIADKESPAQPIYVGVNAGYGSGMSSAYSPILLSTPQVLDAAVQTINALHEVMPFDFGLSLGDAANNSQYNEAALVHRHHRRANHHTQLGRPRRCRDDRLPEALLRRRPQSRDSLVPGHRQSRPVLDGLVPGEREDARTHISAGTIIDMGDNPASPDSVDDTGYYMGVVNGLTPYGDIYGAGPEAEFRNPPAVAAGCESPHAGHRQLNHAGLDAGILQHHVDAGRPRFHAVESGQAIPPATALCRSPIYRSSSSCWTTR